METMNKILRTHGGALDRTVRTLMMGGEQADELRRHARETWSQFRKLHGFKTDAPLLTLPENQTKLGKSAVYSVGLTLQHADVAGVEMCPWRTPECTATCVLDNGNGRYQVVQHARNVRTWFLMDNPMLFVALMWAEIDSLASKHERLLVRLNVNSDVSWHKFIPSMFDDCWDNVDFYDYTKNPSVLRTNGKVAERYRLVYSASDKDVTPARWTSITRFVRAGGTVAVVTVRKRDDAPPKRWNGCRVVDGDATDNRYDERGSFVDLYAKGKARNLTVGGFVRDLSKV